MKKTMIKWLSLFLVAALLLTGCAEADVILQGAVDIAAAILEETEAPSRTIELPELEPGETEESIPPPETESTLPEETEESTSEAAVPEETISEAPETEAALPEDGSYTSRDEVAAYLHQYGHLPSNFLTKKEAEKLGWKNGYQYVGQAAPGKSIGGDYFGNYEGALPAKKGRKYYECDIDYSGKSRNAKRIIFSNDGLIYYTEDHYETFELLYGEE